MKKAKLAIIAILLAVSVIFTGCQKNDTFQKDNDKTQSSKSSAEDDDPDETKKPEKTDKPEKTEEPKETEPKETEPEKPIAGDEFKRGKIQGDTYISEFFGIKVDLSDGYVNGGWNIADDSQLASMIGMSNSTEQAFYDTLENQGVIMDLYAQAKIETGASVNISIENLKVTGSDDLSLEEYLNLGIKQLKDTQGFSVEYAEIDEVEFMGKTSTAAVYVIYVGGNKIYEVQIPIRKGDYMACITFGYTSEEVMELLEIVEPLD